MKKLDKPDLPFDDIFDVCVENMRLPRKRHLQDAKPILIVGNDEYDARADTGELYTIASHTNVTANVSKDDMVYLYEGKLLKEGRSYYDILLTSAPHGTCPFCGQRKVKTLDHYLPKTLYPTFAITPLNLVPCCSDCNKDKDTEDANSPEEQLIHPYYDDIGELIWLNAEVVEYLPVSIVFNVSDFSTSDGVLHTRVTNHFKILGLGELYAAHAAEELENIRGVLVDLKALPDDDSLRFYLRLQRDSCFSRNPNSWNTAMYSALFSSDWFNDQDFSE